MRRRPVKSDWPRKNDLLFQFLAPKENKFDRRKIEFYSGRNRPHSDMLYPMPEIALHYSKSLMHRAIAST